MQQNFDVLPTEDIKPEFTISFNTSNSNSGLQLAINNTAMEGKVVELSWYGPNIVSLEFDFEKI